MNLSKIAGDIQERPFGSWIVQKIQGKPVSSAAPTTNQVLAWNGSQWAPATPGGGSPTGSAGGDLGGTYPNPTVTSGAHLGAATVPISALADPTAGKVIGSNSGAAAVFPPGYEIGYDQITAPVTISSSTEATGTTVISSSAYTFDGNPVMCEFYAPYIQVGAAIGDICRISLFEGSTQIGRLVEAENVAANSLIVGVVGRLRFTPTAASHTYTTTGMWVGHTGQVVGAGAKGTGAFVPAFVRFTKV